METQRIFICGEIGYWWASYQKEALFHAQAAPLDVYIDSQGGSVDDGQSFAALLRYHAEMHNVQVRTRGLGIVASIATAVLLAGTTVELDENCRLLIHNPTVEWLSGGSDKLRSTADALDNVKNILINMYVKRITKSGKATDKTRKQVVEWMDKETTFTAQQALELGFIDAINSMPTEAAEAAKIIDELPEMERTGYQNFVNKISKTTTKNMALDKETQDALNKMQEENKGFFANALETIKSLFVKPETPPAAVLPAVTPEVKDVVTAPIVAAPDPIMQAKLDEAERKLKETEQKLAEQQTKAPVVNNRETEEPAQISEFEKRNAHLLNAFKGTELEKQIKAFYK